jgi:hypothetical protein
MEKAQIDEDEIIVDEYHGKSSEPLSASLISSQEMLTTKDLNVASHDSQQSIIVDRNLISDLPIVVPNDKDVLCGRGKAFFQHEGNKIFREIVGNMIGRYLRAERKSEKSKIVTAIAEEVMKTGARFLKRKDKVNEWYEGGFTLARQKVGNILELPCEFSSVSVQHFLTDICS